jgi:glutathione S-transferase
MKLIIGDKRLSSWSLRPWLLMKHFQIPFEEILIFLDRETTKSEILKFSPSGKVPALVDGPLQVWDSLAIAEHLNEKFPDRAMWPSSPKARAWARSVSCEMHSSFQTMRTLMPHDLQNVFKGFDTSRAASDISRVKEIWADCLRFSKGPFLFGEFSIADAMYAPVVNRFMTYDVSTTDEIKNYMACVRNLPAHQEWIAAALKEKK